MVKESIQEEDITIINIYAPNTGAPQYVSQMLTSMKGEIIFFFQFFSFFFLDVQAGFIFIFIFYLF